MQRRPAGPLDTILNKLTAYKRRRDLKGLENYALTQAHRMALALLSPEDYKIALNAYVDAQRALRRPAVRIPPAGSVRVRWTPAMEAKFKATFALYRDDKRVAHSLRLPLGTVERARLRYIGRMEDVVAHATHP